MSSKKHQPKVILIIGVCGYVGKNLYESLKREYNVFGTDHNKQSFSNNKKFLQADITNSTSISSVIKKVKPDVIIHTAALSSLKKCEEDWDTSYKVNVNGTENIVNTIKSLKKKYTKLIFMSSDYVFDGKKGNYSETDRVSPVTAYGKMKVKSENFIKKHLDNYLIIRSANVYLRGGNFFNYLKSNLETKTPSEYFEDVYYTPTNIDILIAGFKKVIENDWKGVIHIAGQERVSRYEFAYTFADVLLLDKNKLVIPAKCPKSMLLGKDLSLNTNKFKTLAPDITFLTIRESLYLTQGLLPKPYFTFSDDRGSIIGISQGIHFEEINYIVSKAGFIRGNHYHKEANEVIYLIKGKIKVTLTRVDGTFLKDLTINKGNIIALLPYVVHKFEILREACWVNALSKAMIGEHKDIIPV